MAKLAVIGGSGLDNFDGLQKIESISQDTPFGSHSAPIIKGQLLNQGDSSSEQGSHTDRVIFLPRHGADHTLAPHQVNYRANIWMLNQLGVERILACSVVGGVSEQMSPGMFVVPDQIIDYTYGREQTFFDGNERHLQHVDFTEPYSQNMREQLLACLRQCQVPHQSEATYGCTQGPRLETAAEVKRLRRDGCDIVGMTAMPEAVLARELGMEYVGLSLVVNWAAGMEDDILSMDAIANTIKMGMNQLTKLLPDLINTLNPAGHKSSRP